MISISTDARAAAAATSGSTGLRAWVRDHDEKWLFVVLYLGLAIGLSVFVSLFWLLVVAGLHFALELVRQAHHRAGRADVLLHALWEIKLDVGLVLLSLALVVYIDMVLGLLGLQSAARVAGASRAAARVGSRAAAWERNLRTFLLTVDEMARLGYAALMLRRRGKAGIAEPAAAQAPAPRPKPGDAPPVWTGRWGIADRIGVALVVAGLAFIVAGPFITAHDFDSMLTLLRAELQPLPG
jgi:hypothetical protein